jgi:hypothetical protein
MFSAEDVLSRLREKPFRPMRLVGSEGLRYDVYHPDLIFVGRHDLMIGHPDPTTPAIYDRVTRLALVHLVAIEELPVPAVSGNGQP